MKRLNDLGFEITERDLYNSSLLIYANIQGSQLRNMFYLEACCFHYTNHNKNKSIKLTIYTIAAAYQQYNLASQRILNVSRCYLHD